MQLLARSHLGKKLSVLAFMALTFLAVNWWALLSGVATPCLHVRLAEKGAGGDPAI